MYKGKLGRERERERDRTRKNCVVCVYVCMCVGVCLRYMSICCERKRDLDRKQKEIVYKQKKTQK